MLATLRHRDRRHPGVRARPGGFLTGFADGLRRGRRGRGGAHWLTPGPDRAARPAVLVDPRAVGRAERLLDAAAPRRGPGRRRGRPRARDAARRPTAAGCSRWVWGGTAAGRSAGGRPTRAGCCRSRACGCAGRCAVAAAVRGAGRHGVRRRSSRLRRPAARRPLDHPGRRARVPPAARPRLGALGRGWRDGGLAGGLYGVARRGLFAGESMFHRETDASKVALVGLVELLARRRPAPAARRPVAHRAPGHASAGRVVRARSTCALLGAALRHPPPRFDAAAARGLTVSHRPGDRHVAACRPGRREQRVPAHPAPGRHVVARPPGRCAARPRCRPARPRAARASLDHRQRAAQAAGVDDAPRRPSVPGRVRRPAARSQARRPEPSRTRATTRAARRRNALASSTWSSAGASGRVTRTLPWVSTPIAASTWPARAWRRCRRTREPPRSRRGPAR